MMILTRQLKKGFANRVKILRSNSNNIYFNLATEEYLF